MFLLVFYMSLSTEQKKQIQVRKEFYNSNDVLMMNSTVYKSKNSDLPFLNKKQSWLYTYLANNDIEKNYIYTLDGLSNEYRKHFENEKKSKAKNKDKFQFRKSFNASEKIQDSDFKAVKQYFYHANKRNFEMYRNDKGNYIIIEKSFIENLSTLKDRKSK